MRSVAITAVLATFAAWAIASADFELAEKEPVRTGLRGAFERGQQVLERAVAAAGGAEALAGLSTISFALNGDGANGLQDVSPDNLLAPNREGLLCISGSYDYGNDRYFEEIWQELAGGFLLHYGQLYTPGTLYTLSYNEGERWRYEGSPPAVSSAAIIDSTSQFIPPLLLRRALEVRNSVTWAGEFKIEGRILDAIDFAWSEDARYRLLVGRDDSAIRYMQVLSPDPVIGLDTWTYQYTGRREISSLAFPERAVMRRRGALAYDVALEGISVNSELGAATFEPTAELAEVELPGAFVTKRIRGDVFEISGIGGGWYRVQFVERPDYAVVLDAMLSYGASKAIIQEIRKTIGDKPIRYVVISHYHGDHTAGIGAFVEEGSTIVTTEANADLLRRMARVRNGRVLTEGVPDPKFLFVEERAALGAGKHAIEIIKAPATAHVRDMHVIYDAGNRLLIGGDFYSRLVTFNETFLTYSDWLRSAELGVDLLAGSHHRPIPVGEFHRAADRYREERTGLNKPDCAS